MDEEWEDGYEHMERQVSTGVTCPTRVLGKGADQLNDPDSEDSAPILILILTLLMVGGAFFLFNQGYRVNVTNIAQPVPQTEGLIVEQDSELLDAIQRVMDEVRKVSALQMQPERELKSSMSLVMPKNTNGNGHEVVQFSITTTAKGSLYDVERSGQTHLGNSINQINTV